MSQMRKIASMNTPARRRLRSRFSDAGPSNAGGADPSASEPHPTTSQSDKPTATRLRTRSTAKKTNSARQKKRRGAAPSKTETEPLHETTPAAPQNHTGGDEMDVDPAPVVDSCTPAANKKAPRLYRQGTRSSARLKVENPTATYEPTQLEPEVKQTKRERELDDEVTNEDTTELPKKRAKLADDQVDTPLQTETTTTSDIPPVELSEDATDGDLKQSAGFTAEGSMAPGPPENEGMATSPDEDESTAADPDEEGVEYIKRFYLRKDHRGRVSICLGFVRADLYYQSQAERDPL